MDRWCDGWRRRGSAGGVGRWLAAAAAWLLAGVLWGAPAAAVARSDAPAADAVAMATVALAELPPEARTVWRRIHQGGPFPYDKDGTVFFNRERLLPPNKRGYYREYTVPTPGLTHRGARRIVCGGWQPTTPDACYYTADHYASFRRIVP